MTTPNNGGAAFPALNFIVPHDLAEAGVRRLGETQGMTLRDKFADSALKGILGNAYWNEHGPYDPRSVAEAAWEYADAMLAARALSNIEGAE